MRPEKRERSPVRDEGRGRQPGGMAWKADHLRTRWTWSHLLAGKELGVDFKLLGLNLD